MFLKKALIVLLMALCLCGCSAQEISNSAGNFVDNEVANLKMEVATEVQGAVGQKIDDVAKSLATTLDPKLKIILDNMENVKETALVYYKINKKMPIQSKIEPFFEQSFSTMKIDYKASNDEQRAFISYTGKDYGKDKVADITVDPDK